jgi:hypothetical protein
MLSWLWRRELLRIQAVPTPPQSRKNQQAVNQISCPAQGIFKTPLPLTLNF